MTRLVGHPDWDTTTLAHPTIVDPDPSGRGGPLAVTSAAYLAGRQTVGDDPARVLGVGGAVAVRGPAGILEVHETLDGWQLIPSATPSADLADLAGAAILRAARLADARRWNGAER